jgi:hypothetical protein
VKDIQFWSIQENYNLQTYDYVAPKLKFYQSSTDVIDPSGYASDLCSGGVGFESKRMTIVIEFFRAFLQSFLANTALVY